VLLVWDENAWADYLWWHAQDRRVLRRINALLEDIRRNGTRASEAWGAQPRLSHAGRFAGLGLSRPGRATDPIRSARTVGQADTLPRKLEGRMCGAPSWHRA